ncbi:MAG: MFS transporter [Gammaproteobacteria bacterium]|nr:MFS transporter [Gammaproteobacteria bacterium]
MTFWSGPGQTFFISLFGGHIRSELSLSHGEFGGIYSLATLLSALVLIWSGSLIDRLDLKKFSIAAVCGLGVGCFMMSLSAGLVSLFFALFLLRQMGQGLMYMISSTTMVRYLQENRGKASALAGMGYAMSEAIMPLIIVVMLMWVGWRSSWQIFAVMMIASMGLAIGILLRHHHERHTRYLSSLGSNSNGNHGRDRRQWTRPEVLQDKLFYLFMPGLMSQPLLFTGFIFHQVHLVEVKQWSLAMWGTAFSLYAIVSVLAKLVTGFWVDRYGAIRLVPIIALPMALGLLFLALSSHIAAGIGFLVLTGITVGFQTTVSGPFWSELYGTQHLGAIKSLASATMVFMSAVSPVVIGWFIDKGTSMETLFLWGSLYIFATSALAYVAYRLCLSGRNESIIT